MSARQYNRISEGVRLRLDEILNKEKLQRVTDFGPSMYLVGKGEDFNVNNEDIWELLVERDLTMCGNFKNTNCV